LNKKLIEDSLCIVDNNKLTIFLNIGGVMRFYRVVILWALLSLVLGAGQCNRDSLTMDEAKTALEEVATSNNALTFISGSVEISTNFTIGQAVEDAAQELKTFIESQLPCADIVLEDNTLTIDYGAYPGWCFYNGQTYTGIHSVTITSAKLGEVVVDHVWEGLENDELSASGTSHVTWSAENSSRQVEHELEWTTLANGNVRTGTGNRIQTPLGLLVGIEEDGERTWSSDIGDWELEIDQLEMRWLDPIPQSGSLVLDTPFDKSLEIDFSRVDENTIKATVTSGSNSFDFNISRLGVISS
jgi:hypothetical protein